VTDAHSKLDSIVRGRLRDDAVRAIRCYFEEPAAANGRTGFTGRRFERFEGGGDRADIRDVITPVDVLAVTLLSVEGGIGRVALAVIEEKRREISDLLRRIPVAALHDVTYDTIAEGSAAWRLWTMLCAAGGKDRRVTANKLLARKRPELLPVYDSVVKAQLGSPQNFWQCYWTWFNEDPSRVTDTEKLRTDVGDIEDISLLRCLDVALWMFGMRHAGQHC
jgi:Family of unknown function (DUF6308)